MEPRPKLGRTVRLAGAILTLASCGGFGLLVISTGHQIQPGWQTIFFGLVYLVAQVGIFFGPVIFLVGALMMYAARR